MMECTRRSRILACGSALPRRVVGSAELAGELGIRTEAIVRLSGIHERRIASDDETTAGLALSAAQTALQRSGLKGDDIDLVIVATATPDRTLPASAVRVQAGLGATRGAAFDVQAACSGFIHALAIADCMLRLGEAETAVVVGAETTSRIVDQTDAATAMLFGDGAGAVILQATHHDRVTRDTPGILSTHLRADGRYEDFIRADGGPSSTGQVGVIRMNGAEVFRHALMKLAAVAREALSKNGLSAEDIRWVVPHQANLRIIEPLASALQIPLDKFVLTIKKHGNTSAASIPLALDEAVTDGRIRSGDLLLFDAMGAGLTWGAALVRW